MLDYQTKGFSKFGARMGRHSDLSRDAAEACYIRKVPIDDGGYDPGGAYWGTPANLFFVESLDSGQSAYLRAPSLKAAKAQFPAATWQDGPIDEPAEYDAAEMVQAYITAALWSTSDDRDECGDTMLDAEFSADDLAPKTLATMTDDCAKFLAKHAADIGANASQAGHDLWFTRNRHGVGFSDRTDGQYREGAIERLDAAARALREVYLYVGDDGKIYQG